MPPAKCLTRQQELSGSKPEKTIKLDDKTSGLIVKDAVPEQEIADLALFQAMCRRALAMDLVGMASYDTIMRWVNRMFALYTQPAAPTFAKVSQTQLLRADRQSFLRLAELVAGGFKVGPSGTLPLDDAINMLQNDMTVTYHLLPLPSTGGPAKADSSKASGSKSDSSPGL